VAPVYAGMRYIVCGGHDRNPGPLDLACLAAIHRPEAHPFLAGLRRRLALLEPSWPWDRTPGTVYQGGAKGWDTAAAQLQRAMGGQVETFEADWERFGNGAGPRRNADMLAGRHSTGPMEPPSAVVAGPGGTGTADMVARARAKGLPVLDLAQHAKALEPFQRWTKDDAWLARSDRRACLEVQAKRPGVGPPIMSGHWMKVNGHVVITPWCLYVGRDAHGLTGHPWLANPFPVKPTGDGFVTVYNTPDGVVRCAPDKALDYYRAHLAKRAQNPRVAGYLEAIARDRRILVCWCGDSKPCHACIIAEFAVHALCVTAVTAACRPA